MTTKTFVFIHGAFVTKHSWEPWVQRFQSLGYRVVTVAWPGHDRPVAELRAAHPDAALGKITLQQVLDHHVRAIQALDEKPVLIGHSLGGLMTQILLERDLAVAGVAIDSVPPPGVLPTQWSFFRAGWPLINPFISASEPYMMSFEEFQYAFANGLPLEEQREAYETQCVPESRQIVRDGLTAVAKVDFKMARPPLLFIAGTNDHFIPAALNNSNYHAYQHSPSVTDFKEFPGRDHYLIGQKDWQELATYILDWLQQRQLVSAAEIPVAA
jgi:pimeloyl-ACP methyl ester carboxylesterase